MRAFKQDVGVAGRVGLGARISTQTVDEGPYRLRPANDVPWTSYGNGRHESIGQKIGEAFAAMARVIVPVLVLLGCVSGIYLYRDVPMPIHSIGVSWTTAAHLILPIAFFCVFLTNRRYGPGYAFAQVVVAAAVVVAASVFGRDTVSTALTVETVPVREAAAFGAAFFAASFVSIVAFDGARGAYWFTAPLFGFLATAIVFPLVFFPLLGTEGGWLMNAVEYAAVLAGGGIVLMVPFYLLRGIIPPISGFGGY